MFANQIKTMFNIHMRDVLSAVISAVIVAIVGYLSTLTDISSINYHQILSISVLTGLTSLLKALGTNSEGNFMGALPIKDPKY